MAWFDMILGKRRVTPQEISKCFKVLTLIPLFAFFFHFVDVYPEGGLNGTGWRWKGTIKFSRCDPNALFDAKYQFPNTVEVAPQTANVIFSFPSFKEWFNIYTGSFFFLDTLKWLLCIFVPWQIAKAISDKTDFWATNEKRRRRFPQKEDETLMDKGAFKGFSTEGVKYLRRAAGVIPFIPILNYLSRWIFIKYAATQNSYAQLSKYLTDDNFMMAEFLISIQVSIILFGIAAIFQYGKQLKEETELTV